MGAEMWVRESVDQQIYLYIIDSYNMYKVPVPEYTFRGLKVSIS